jgi:hypothetical protein
MSLPAFDTHAYVKRLREAGVEEKQAEAQAELQAQVLSSLVTEKLATKDDILRLENATKEDISRLAQAAKDDIVRLENKTEQEFIRINGKFNLLNWMVGFLLAGVVSTLAGVVSILFKLSLHS